MVHTVDDTPLSMDSEGHGPEALSACATVVWRGVVELAPALRAAVLALFKAMGKDAAEPMVCAVPVHIGTILAEPAVGEAFGGRSNEDNDAILRQTVSRLRNLRLGDVCNDVDLTGSFARSPFLDICEITRTVETDRRVAAWLVRCGQWACWSLTRGDRKALCRLARRQLTASP